MKRGLIALLLCAALPALADHPQRGRVVAVDRSEMREDLASLSRLVDELAAEQRPHRRARLASRARQQLQELKRKLRQAPRVDRIPEPPPIVVAPAPPAPPPPPAHPVVYPIAQWDFEELKRALEREVYPRDRLRVLEAASPSNWFLVAQTQELLAMFVYPSDRLKAMRALKPRILDVENYYKLYGSFEYPSHKAELKEILSQ